MKPKLAISIAGMPRPGPRTITTVERTAGSCRTQRPARLRLHRLYDDAGGLRLCTSRCSLVLATQLTVRSWPKLKAYVEGVTISVG